jgi:hypothetical protein
MTFRPTSDPDTDLTPPPIRIGRLTFAWGERTYVMGILNVTPDSFSGDGLIRRARAGEPVDAVTAAVEQAREMVQEGADLLDIGGESTRPWRPSRRGRCCSTTCGGRAPIRRSPNWPLRPAFP